MTALSRQWHEDVRLQSAVRSAAGGAALWLIATALLRWHGVTWIMPAAIALAMLRPDRRRLIASLAAAAVIFEYFIKRNDAPLASALSEPARWLSPVVLIAGVLLGLYVVYRVARAFPAWPAALRRFPVLALHGAFWLGLALYGAVPALGIVTELGPWLIWRLSYLVQLASRGRFAQTGFADHLFYLWPAFGGYTPYGKGFEYLSRREAGTASTQAHAQLAGVKVLLLAALWQAALALLDALVLGGGAGALPAPVAAWLPPATLVIAPIGDAIAAPQLSTVAAWSSMYAELVRATLVVAIRGHIVVGCLRLLGFNVFRNTYKPLLSESILEFWNRFSYYFKELMVEFFFYPVFLRCTWAGPRLRLFLAVFAAAFVGNLYFHMLLYPGLLASGDVSGLWEALGSRSVYCFLLASGVWVSMLRQQKLRANAVARTLPRRIRAIAGVLTFYGFIHIWNARAPGAEMADRLAFCLRLVGIH